MAIYFTADTHFYHYNIIEFCGRPIVQGTWPGNIPGWMSREEAINEMNSVLVARWNERIKPNDEVYHLGDFAFCGVTKARDILDQLNGRKYWIRGNHDHALAKKVGDYFEWIRDYYVLRVHDSYQTDTGAEQQFHQAICLMHFPMLSWENMHHGYWHLHGHCHGSLPDFGGLRMDVGVDTNNLYPYSYQEIKNIMALRSVSKVDHHGK